MPKLLTMRIVMAIACVGAGVIVGLLIGIGLSVPGTTQWSNALASRHARSMFCYGPPPVASSALIEYRKQLESLRDETWLWKREYALTLASQALIEQKREAGHSTWGEAENACRASGSDNCDEESLKKQLAALCKDTLPR